MRLRASAAMLVLALAACSDTLPSGISRGARVAVAPAFPSNFSAFAQALSIQSVAIKVTPAGDTATLARATRTFSPSSDTLAFALDVPFSAETLAVGLVLSFLDQNGTPLFVDSVPSLVLRQGTVAAPTADSVRYVGPGSTAAFVTISPNPDTVHGATTAQFSVTATDGQQLPLTQVYVHWSSDNPHARIDATGKLTTDGTAGTAIVRATVPSSVAAGGYVSDSAVVTILGGTITPSGSIEGSLGDTAQMPIVGASIQAVLNGVGTTFNTSTDSNGTFTVGPLPAGTYTINISATGMASTKYLNAVMPSGSNVIIVLPPIPLVPATGKTGSASGTVSDAQTGLPLAGARVRLYQYVNAQGTTAVDSTLTDTTGAFTFASHAEGTYTLEAVDSGYVNGTRTAVILGSTSSDFQNIVMSKGGPQFRAVLTWAATPPDLDLHAYTYDTLDTRTEVYYGNAGDTSFVALDHDATSGYGPETITIYHKFAGVDTFFVYNYSASGSPSDSGLAHSGAVVRVYNNNALQLTMYVPDQIGTYWYLFTWDGTNLVPLNTVVNVPPAAPQAAERRSAPKRSTTR